jgi:hypothetical protein
VSSKQWALASGQKAVDGIRQVNVGKKEALDQRAAPARVGAIGRRMCNTPLVNETHISIMSPTSESSDRHNHQYSCGRKRDEDAPEVHTQWVKNKTILFSSRSMLR